MMKENSVGQWISVEAEMPDDEMAVIDWSEDLEDWTVAYHDSDLAVHGCTGWVDAHDHVPVHGVTHWCGDVRRPGVARNTEVSDGGPLAQESTKTQPRRLLN